MPRLDSSLTIHVSAIRGSPSTAAPDLADILLAIQKHYTVSFAVNALGDFEQRAFINDSWLIRPSPCSWNLRMDDLTAQSDATAVFIHGLLEEGGGRTSR